MPAMNETLLAEIKQLITNDLRVNLREEEIAVDVSLMEDGLGLDSIAIMEFISLLEARFGFRLQEEELNMDAFANLQSVAALVEAKRQAA